MTDSKQFNVRLPQDLVVAIDAARGGVSQSVWIRAALEQHLGMYEHDELTKRIDERIDERLQSNAGMPLGWTMATERVRNGEPVGGGSTSLGGFDARSRDHG